MTSQEIAPLIASKSGLLYREAGTMAGLKAINLPATLANSRGVAV